MSFVDIIFYIVIQIAYFQGSGAWPYAGLS